jgi:hypothetical protein
VSSLWHNVARYEVSLARYQDCSSGSSDHERRLTSTRRLYESTIVSRMTHLGASAALQQYVLQVIETGSGSLGHGGASGGSSPLDQIIQAGYTAFTNALHATLYVSAALLAGAALLSAVTLRQRRHAT